MASEALRRLAPDPEIEVVFDSAREGREAAFARYADLYAAGADVEPRGPRLFATVGARVLPGMALLSRTLRGVDHARDARRVRRDGFDHFTLHLVRDGEIVLDADGTERRVRAGDGVLVDMTRPFRSTPAARFFTLSLARELLVELDLPTAALHGVLLPGLARRLEPTLAQVFAGADTVAAREEIARALSEQVRPAPKAPVLRLRDRQERARRFIEENLAREDLSPALVAAATGMSRATLYRAFEPLGGVADWVQLRRLQHVRVLLERSDLTISRAGQLAGLANASHLTVAFQARFGVTPTAFRQARRVDGGRAPVAVQVLRDMTSTLAPSPGPHA